MRIERHPAGELPCLAAIGIKRPQVCNECGRDPRKRRAKILFSVFGASGIRWATLCRKCLRELGRQIRETGSDV